MTWKEWASWYSDLFGLITERDAAMIAAWIREVFAPQGFSPHELRDAARVVASHDPPRFREQHLPRLIAEVRTARATRAAVTPSDWTICKDCEGTGMVSVPQDLPGFLARVKGHRHMASVICYCPAGKALGQKSRAGWLTLEKYEAICPDWRDTLRQWREDQLAYQRAHGHAQAVDQTLGAIVNRLAGRSHGRGAK